MSRLFGRALALLAFLFLFLLVVSAAAPATAASPESVIQYDTAIAVQPGGAMRVTETITYDFGTNQRHGIQRWIPTRVPYDGTHTRIYRLSDVAVTVDGTATKVSRVTDGDDQQLIIGDPDRTITGTHTYVITYTVAGALNTNSGHVEFYWNVVGTRWTVPIAAATVTVTAPAAITAPQCYVGRSGSRQPCAAASSDGSSATFRSARMTPGEGLTVVASLPVGSVANATPILISKRTLSTDFAATPVTMSVAVVLALIGILTTCIVLRRRRPRASSTLEITAPDGISPAHAAVLRNGRATRSDITATIIDLAVRHFLHIRELRRGNDWELTRLAPAGGELSPYERTILSGLFHHDARIRVSELKGGFAETLETAQHTLNDDVIRKGWFRVQPVTRRLRLRTGAVVFVVAAIVTTSSLAAHTHAALVGAGLVIGALALIPAAWRLPLPTSKGAALLARVESYRRYLASVQQTELVSDDLARHLPYAMVFGQTRRFSAMLAEVNAEPPVYDRAVAGAYWFSWYSPSFYNSLDRFGSQTALVMGTHAAAGYASSGSSGGYSGGDSGGGGGGGGGSSW